MRHVNLTGVIQSGHRDGEHSDALKPPVATHKRCADGEGGCCYPQVVLAKWQAEALLGQFHARVMIARSRGNWFTRQRREDCLSFCFQCGSALALGQSSQTEQDLAARDAAGDDAIIRLNAIRGSSRIRALIAFMSSR